MPAIRYGGTEVVGVQVVCEGPQPTAINTELQLIIEDGVVGSGKEFVASNVAYSRWNVAAGSQRPINRDFVIVWCFDILARFIAGRCLYGVSVEEPVSINHPILVLCIDPSNAVGVGGRILAQICHLFLRHTVSGQDVWVGCLPRHLEKRTLQFSE